MLTTTGGTLPGRFLLEISSDVPDTFNWAWSVIPPPPPPFECAVTWPGQPLDLSGLMYTATTQIRIVTRVTITGIEVQFEFGYNSIFSTGGGCWVYSSNFCIQTATSLTINWDYAQQFVTIVPVGYISIQLYTNSPIFGPSTETIIDVAVDGFSGSKTIPLITGTHYLYYQLTTPTSGALEIYQSFTVTPAIP